MTSAPPATGGQISGRGAIAPDTLTRSPPTLCVWGVTMSETRRVQRQRWRPTTRKLSEATLLEHDADGVLIEKAAAATPPKRTRRVLSLAEKAERERIRRARGKARPRASDLRSCVLALRVDGEPPVQAEPRHSSRQLPRSKTTTRGRGQRWPTRDWLDRVGR